MSVHLQKFFKNSLNTLKCSFFSCKSGFFIPSFFTNPKKILLLSVSLYTCIFIVPFFGRIKSRMIEFLVNLSVIQVKLLSRYSDTPGEKLLEYLCKNKNKTC